MNTLLDLVKYQTLVILKTTSIHGIPNHPIIISLYSNYAIRPIHVPVMNSTLLLSLNSHTQSI